MTFADEAAATRSRRASYQLRLQCSLQVEPIASHLSATRRCPIYASKSPMLARVAFANKYGQLGYAVIAGRYHWPSRARPTDGAAARAAPHFKEALRLRWLARFRGRHAPRRPHRPAARGLGALPQPRRADADAIFFHYAIMHGIACRARSLAGSQQTIIYRHRLFSSTPREAISATPHDAYAPAGSRMVIVVPHRLDGQVFASILPQRRLASPLPIGEKNDYAVKAIEIVAPDGHVQKADNAAMRQAGHSRCTRRRD